MFSKKHLLLSNLLLVAIVITGCPKYVIDPPPPSGIASIPPDSSQLITGDFFKLEFGPGSKGVSNFGPGSKGVSNFGPGSKGVSNLHFNVSIPDNLVNKDLKYSTEAVNDDLLKLNDLIILIKKDDKLIAKTTLLPIDTELDFTISSELLEPGDYTLFVMAENNIDPLQVVQLVKLEDNLEVKIVLYAKELKREDLDIAIRTKPIVIPSPQN